MIENFDWNQFIFFPEDSSNEENLCVDNNVVNTPDVVSEFVVPESLRLLGYYNKPNQKMNPETVKVREAQQIYDLLTYTKINSKKYSLMPILYVILFDYPNLL